MSGAWTTLFEEVESLRTGDFRELGRELRSALAPLQSKGVEQHDCWVSTKKGLDGFEVSAKDGAGIPFRALPDGILAAELRVLCRVSTDRRQLLALDLLIEGQRDDETRFWIGVHLPPPRAQGVRDGIGPCSHPALHCHVGPDHHTAPQVRVPLPRMPPSALLSWLLCQVYPDLEPEPWQ